MMKQKQTIAIFGGTGFLGKHVCHALAKAQHTLLVFTRNPARHADLSVLPTCRLIKIDNVTKPTIEHDLKNVDVVINLVGILHETSRRDTFDNIHVAWVEKLLDMAKASQVQRFIHVSALGSKKEASSRYLQSKAKAQAAVLAANNEKMRTTCLAPSVIYGKNDHFIGLLKNMVTYSPGLIVLPLASTVYAPVFVQDVVDIVLQSLDNPATHGHCYDLAGPQAYSMKELLCLVAETMHKKTWVIGLNMTMSKCLAAVLQVLPFKLLTKDNCLSASEPNVSQQNISPPFVWQPRSLRDMLPILLGKQTVDMASWQKTARR